MDKMNLAAQRYQDRGDAAKAKQAFEMSKQMNRYKLGDEQNVEQPTLNGRPVIFTD